MRTQENEESGLLDSSSEEALASSAPNSVDGGLYIERTIDDNTIPETAVIGREIGWTSAYLIVISRLIGSGIFALPGTVLSSSGSPTLAVLLWVIGGIIAGCGLTVALEYGCMLPRSGGEKTYLEFTYRRPPFLASTMVATHAIFLGITTSNAIVFAKYLIFAIGLTPTELLTKFIAVALVSCVTVMHGCFYKRGIFVQNLFAWIKLALIAVLILGSTFAVAWPSNALVTSKDARSPQKIASNSHQVSLQLGILSTTLFKIMYAYSGLENLNNVLDEVKNPIKTLKSVAIASLLTAMVVYVMVNLAFFATLELEELREGGDLVAALFFQRIFGNKRGGQILPLAIAISSAGTVMVTVFSQARLNQEVARQGMLPFSELLGSSRPFGSPLGGLMLHYVPTCLAIILPSSDTVYGLIADIKGYTGQFFGLALAVGLLWLRREKAHLTRPFRASMPVIYLRILLSCVLITAPLFPSVQIRAPVRMHLPLYGVWGLSILIMGVLYWCFWAVVLPKIRHYTIVEETTVLKDGTTINKLIKTPL